MNGNLKLVPDYHGNVVQFSSSSPEVQHIASERCLLNDKDARFRQWKYGLIELNRAGIVAFVRKCGDLKDLIESKRIHTHIIDIGKAKDVFFGNLLVQTYGKCGALEDALRVFRGMQERNVFTWNLMIAACIQNEELECALCLFNRAPEKDVVSWTSMITAYAQQEYGERAFHLFQKMHQEGVIADKIVYISVLDACASQTTLAEGKWAHSQVVARGYESDMVVRNALVYMYGTCGCLDDARRIFHETDKKDIISWNAIISGYVLHGSNKKALQLFHKMEKEGMLPNKITFLIIIDSLRNRAEGKLVHANMISKEYKLDPAIGTILVSMYSRNRNIQDARRVFESILDQDTISWNAIIAAYAQHGDGKEACRLFERMQLEDIAPNKVIFVSTLDAVANLAFMGEGKQIHARIMACGLDSDVVVATALVKMYGNCGSLVNARAVFDKMDIRNQLSWTAMTTIYAQYGRGTQAILLFWQMQSEGMAPDNTSLVSILAACAQSGLVFEGCNLLLSINYYDTVSSVEHYNCIIDLFGRFGWLEEAKDFIHNMPLEQTCTLWMTLLSASVLHNDVGLGQAAANCVFELDPDCSAPYVLLSNLYAANVINGRIQKTSTLLDPKNTP